MAGEPVTLDFSKSQPLNTGGGVSLDFSKAQPLSTSTAATPPPPPKDFGGGFDKGFQKALGLKGDDPNKLSFGDIASQMLHNVAGGISDAYNAGGTNSSFASKLLNTPASLLENGINGMASTFQAGIKDLKDGVAAKDHGKIGSGVGQLLGSLSQIATAMEAPEKASNAATAATDFSPRTVQPGGVVEGARRPANAFEGSINRSVGATKALTRYGNPAQAIIDENIASPSTPGRLIATYSKLNELKPQLDQALQSSQATTDLQGIIAPIVANAKQVIAKSVETAEEKAAALKHLEPLEQQGNQGAVPVSVANETKGRIGDAVNWQKRPAPLPKPVEDAYKQVYGAIKQDVNSKVPEAADLNERVTNLMALKNSLAEEAQPNIRIGKGPEAGYGWTQRLEAYLGHFAAPVIIGAQSSAPAISGGATLGAILASKRNQ